MTSKLVPADPAKVMVIRKVTPNITTCSTPFARFGKFKVGGRGTIGSFPPSSPLYYPPLTNPPKKKSDSKPVP